MIAKLMIVGIIGASWALTAPRSYGQINAAKAGSAEALQRLQQHRDAMAAMKSQPGVLNYFGLKVGATGRPESIDARATQVIDENQMIVEIQDARVNSGRTLIWLKCPTAGITDGKFWRGGEWKDVTGSDTLSVTGTKTYKTVGGGTRTVFVLEPLAGNNPVVEKNPLPAKPKAAAEKVARVAGKTGTAAYDVYPEPLRGQLVKDWESELNALKKAIKEDEERLRAATTAKLRQNFQRHIARYKANLVIHERNDPPYLTKEQRQAQDAGK